MTVKGESQMADILAVDDTRSIRSTLKILLEEEGHEVRLATDGEEALAEYEKKRPDMLLLDIMMPKKNGYQVLKRIRRDDPALPVIFLSAKGSPADVSLGLDLGADDYLPKPFDSEVLASRIKAVLRRVTAMPVARPQAAEVEDVFNIGSHRVEMRSYRIVAPKGKVEPLTSRELRLLRMLVEHPDEVVTRDTMISEIWGYASGTTTRTVDQHVLQLRKKLGKDASHIETVYGAGYRYVP